MIKRLKLKLKKVRFENVNNIIIAHLNVNFIAKKIDALKGEVHSENYFFFYYLKLFSSALRDEQKKPREKILIFGEVMNV